MIRICEPCRLGMVVWQDAVSMFWEKPYWEGERYRTPLEKAQFEAELRRMVEVRGSIFFCIPEARSVSSVVVFSCSGCSNFLGSRMGGFRSQKHVSESAPTHVAHA